MSSEETYERGWHVCAVCHRRRPERVLERVTVRTWRCADSHVDCINAARLVHQEPHDNGEHV